MIVGGGELVFCGHHANKYAEDLAKIAVQVASDPEFVVAGHGVPDNQLKQSTNVSRGSTG